MVGWKKFGVCFTLQNCKDLDGVYFMGRGLYSYPPEPI
jgi:hypothetical protein